MSRNRLLFYSAVLLLFASVIWGCSSANSDAPAIDANGHHPANWVQAHPDAFKSNPSACHECHSTQGSTDLRGGISRVSCFSASFNGITCHPNGPSGHPDGWASPDSHGASAKRPVGGNDGFEKCQVCHGNNFAGGIVNKSCLNNSACHGAGVNSPHPKKPWRGARSHSATDTSNVRVCAGCHTAGANLSAVFQSASYASGNPGCFNNTLCHGQIGHNQGWRDPGQHGVAAKAAPGGGTGLAYCKNCHGQDFRGSGAATSCFSCHTTAPHSPAPWRSTLNVPTPRKHTNTDHGNSTVCAGCHLNNQRLTTPQAVPAGTSPDCFNNTLCHGLVGHQSGWSLPANHGLQAKLPPPGAGFNYCQECHGAAFNGGLALTSCINNPSTGCHGPTVAAPHPKKPWLSATLSHVTTSELNVGICSACHFNGANLSPVFVAKYSPNATGSAGCFNNTLCHPNLGDCTNCHSSTKGTGRRLVIGAGGISGGDFALTSHHVQNFPVNQATCDICHDQSNHRSVDPTNGVKVLLTNQDTGATITYDGTGASIEPFCVSCHNGDGAAIQPVPMQPFKDSGDSTTPPNIFWTVGNMAHSSGNACFNCHGNSAGVSDTASGSTNSPKFNGHGSASTKLMRFPYDATIAARSSSDAGNICHNCHGNPAVGTAPNVLTPMQQSYGHGTVTADTSCFDCHDQHMAKAGIHTVGSATLSGALQGAPAAQVTFSAANWGGATVDAVNLVDATAEYKICFRCHNFAAGAGATAKTDQSWEFNPANLSGHPVASGLINYSNSAAPKGLSAAQLLAPWNNPANIGNQVMYCSDCHGNSGSGAQGPHGSATKWLLVGVNRAWPYTNAASNGTSAAAGTLFTLANRTTGLGTANGLFCYNCHPSTNVNNVHSTGNHSGVPCVGCHIRVPHGGKVARLINTNTAGKVPRYAPDGNGGGTIYIYEFIKRNSGSYSKGDCLTGAGCHGNGTGGANPSRFW